MPFPLSSVSTRSSGQHYQARHNEDRSRNDDNNEENARVDEQSLGTRQWLHELNKAYEKGRQGKEITGPMASYCRAGKLIPRIIDPWLDLDTVFIRGLTADGLLSNDEDSNESSGHVLSSLERHDHAYKEIMKLIPNFRATLTKLCHAMQPEEQYEGGVLQKLVGLMSIGMRRARTADTHKVKKNIVQLMTSPMRQVAYPLPFDKSSRGFNHVDTGRLLCPARLVSNFDLDFLLKLKNGDIEVTGNDYPFFLYSDGGYSTEEPFEGLCRGDLLIKTMAEIFFGSGNEKEEKHASRPPIAEKLNIKAITPAMIAYAATQARFGLCATSQWGQDDGLFVLPEFFYAVLELFEQPDDPWAAELLEFWNRTFFSSRGLVRRKRKGPPPPPDPDSDRVRMKRLRAERSFVAQ